MIRLAPPSARADITPRLSVWIDALRWIAAALVFQSHLRSLFFVDYDPALHASPLVRAYYFITGFGHQAVVVFFVLSGYLVGGEIVRGLAAGSFGWKRYLIRRASRLYTVYLVALALGLLLDHVGLFGVGPPGLYSGGILFPTLNFAVSERLGLETLLGNLLFLQRIAVEPFGSNVPLWSLAYEAWYYLLFPLLLWPFCRHAAPWPHRLAVLLAAAAALWITRDQILPLLPVWMLGLLPLFVRVRTPAAFAALAAALLLAVLAAIRLGKFSALGEWSTQMILGLAVALLLAAAGTAAAPPASASEGSRIASAHHWLAGFSYSLYLLHWPLVLFGAAVIHHLGHPLVRQPFTWFALPAVLAFTLFAYAACWLVARATEYRTPDLRRWLETRLLPSTK